MSLIIRSEPQHLSESVSLDPTIQVYFMLDMNTQYLNNETVILMNMVNQSSELIDIQYRMKILTIKPLFKLEPLTHYQLVVLGGPQGVRDITGRTLPQDYRMQFGTANVRTVNRPSIKTPADRSIVTDNQIVTWNPIPEASYYEVEVSKHNTFNPVLWPLEEQKIYGTGVIPHIEYDKSNYFLRVRAVSTDGVRSAWSPTVRFYYDGVQRVGDLDEEDDRSYVKYITAVGGEVDLAIDKLYERGTGQLLIYLNGMKLRPCSNQLTLDGDYFEVSSSLVKFIEPLLHGDMIEYRIEQAGSEPPIRVDEGISGAQLDALQTIFTQLDETVEISTPLSLVSSNPSHEAVNVALNAQGEIVLEFSQDIDSSSVNNSTFYMVAQKN